MTCTSIRSKNQIDHRAVLYSSLILSLWGPKIWRNLPLNEVSPFAISFYVRFPSETVQPFLFAVKFKMFLPTQPLVYWFLSGRFLPWGLRWNQYKVGHSSMWNPVCGICNSSVWWQDYATLTEKFAILWNIKPYNVVDVYWRLGVTTCLHLQDWRVSEIKKQTNCFFFLSLPSDPQLKAVCFSETFTRLDDVTSQKADFL